MNSLQTLTITLIIFVTLLLVQAHPAQDQNVSATRIGRPVVVSIVTAILLAIAALIALYIFRNFSSLRQVQANRPVYMELVPPSVSQFNSHPITVPKPAEVFKHSKLKAPAVGRGLK